MVMYIAWDPFIKETVLRDGNIAMFILAYIIANSIHLVSFFSIVYFDKMEFMCNAQECLKFKHKMFFIIQASKEKRVVAKNTFICEIICYFLILLSIIFFIITLFLPPKTGVTIWGIVCGINFIYSFIVCTVRDKVEVKWKQQYNSMVAEKEEEKRKLSKK